MPSGKLGIAAPLAATWTTVYTVPPGKVATANIRITNRDVTNASLIKVAISAADGAALNSEYIEPVDYFLEGGEVLEDIGIVMGAGEIVNVYSSTANITVRVHGFESNP